MKTTVSRNVIGILPGKIITEHLTYDIAPVDGDKRPDLARDLIRIAVIERHGKNGNRATGFVRGFGLQRGAIASTVCHDHHNIAVVGADYADMALAANRLGQIEGGFVVVEGGKVLAELSLPVAGLMSLESFEHVRDRLVALRAAAAESTDPYDREHVTPFLYRRPERFALAFHHQTVDEGDVRWTVDRPDDLAFVRAVYEALYPVDPAFSSDDVRAFVRSRPDLLAPATAEALSAWSRVDDVGVAPIDPLVARLPSGR